MLKSIVMIYFNPGYLIVLWITDHIESIFIKLLIFHLVLYEFPSYNSFL